MRLFSNVWSENTALFERLMEIHSNVHQELYYGFKESSNWMRASYNVSPRHRRGGISSSILSVIFTDKFALSQSDARISVAYKISPWKSLTKCLMKCPPGRSFVPQWSHLITFQLRPILTTPFYRNLLSTKNFYNVGETRRNPVWT